MSAAASLAVILPLAIASYYFADVVPVATATTPTPLNADASAPAPPVTATQLAPTDLRPEIALAPLKGAKGVFQTGRLLRQRDGG